MKNEKFLIIGIILLSLFYWSIKNINLLNWKYYEVIFFDLELWDATMIKTPENKIILIDWWEWNNLISKLSDKLWFFEKTIDLIILSHPQSDHIWWLVEIIKKFYIWEIWLTNNEYKSNEFNEFIKEINKNNINYKFVTNKDDLIFDNNLKIDTLYPLSSWEWNKLCNQNINDCSIVVKIELWKNNKKTILFTWDIWKWIEEILIKKSNNLKSDILKSPHHWSKNNLNENFLKIVKPEIAIIMSKKNNRFWHPHKETIESYKKNWIKSLITWEIGNIEMKFD